MKNDVIEDIFKIISFPDRKLKSIKFKRFLVQMNDNLDFTEIDLLLSKIHSNYSDKKLSIESFIQVLQMLIEHEIIMEDQIKKFHFEHKNNREE